MEGDIFINSIVIACAEMSGYLISGFLFSRIGIKPSYFVYYSIIALGSALNLTLGNKSNTLHLVSLLITFYGVSSSCMTNWMANARLFPVIFASSTNGLASFFARSLNILAPQVAELNDSIPFIMIGSLAVTAAVASVFLKTEKQGREKDEEEYVESS